MQIADAHMAMIHATERLLALLADAVRTLDQRVSALEQQEKHTMSDSPTPDEEAPPPAPDEAPPADPAPEAAAAIAAGTVAELCADSDAVEITHDVAPDAPR